MILSVSRRTDIPAFYSEWFINRLNDGFVLVRNPMNYHQVSKVNLSPDVIDCIVFWTKNAEPMLKYIDAIQNKYNFYFQHTINPYNEDIEPNLPSLDKRIENIKILSDKIGKERVILRYDPVILTDKYTVEWHITQFESILEKLSDSVETVVFSFVDFYPKVENNIKELNFYDISKTDMEKIAQEFSKVTNKYGLVLQTCSEEIDLDKYGIRHGACIDREFIEKIIACSLNVKKDSNQRASCGCVSSVDIGQYNTCKHGCKYCYANFNPQSVITFSSKHNNLSPFLTGESENGDIIKERKMESLAVKKEYEQLKLF